MTFTCIKVILLLYPIRITVGIIGGKRLEIEKAPYNVNYGDICGGVLIGQMWALTTAHCGTKKNFIRIGSTLRLRGLKVLIKQHIPHPRFQERHEFDFDIQLLRIVNPVRRTEKIQTIGIGWNNPFFAGDFITVTGWGYDKEKGEYSVTLNEVSLQLVSFRSCQKVELASYNKTLTKRMFCAGGGKGKDACQGDSGGAAVKNNTLVGLSSFGFGCGRADIPGVYTRVSEKNIREWVYTITGL